jgi:hypothetical protein
LIAARQAHGASAYHDGIEITHFAHIVCIS